MLSSNTSEFSFKLSAGKFDLRSNPQQTVLYPTTVGSALKPQVKIEQLSFSRPFNDNIFSRQFLAAGCFFLCFAVYFFLNLLPYLFQDLNKIQGSPVFNVSSAVMWELGGRIYLAVASGYPHKKIAVFRLDHNEADIPNNWTRDLDLQTTSHIGTLRLVIFSDGTEKQSHLSIVRYSSA